MDGGEEIGVVCERPRDGRAAGLPHGNAARNQASGRHEQPRTRHLGEAAVAQAAQTAAESHQVGGCVGLDPTLVGDDPALEIGRGEVEIEGSASDP